MNFLRKRSKMLGKLSTIMGIATLIAIQSNLSLATGIGTAEVQTATENIKRVITSIAMPLGRCSYFCKYCCSSN